MTEPVTQPAALRTGLIDTLQAARAAESDVLAALDPAVRDAPAPDGGWGPKDTQAHLSAWRGRMAERLRALRAGTDEPTEVESDEMNAILHAERAGWSWDQIATDADADADDLIAEIEAAADETLALPRISGLIMGNGSEHTLTHLTPIAARTGLESRTLELADAITAIIDRGGWPSRAAAFARYNLACFHALSGNLDVARSLLRQALPEQEELRTFAPDDDDLLALRAEIPTLMGNDASRLRADIDAVIDPNL
jgi:hypothetical protein